MPFPLSCRQWSSLKRASGAEAIHPPPACHRQPASSVWALAQDRAASVSVHSFLSPCNCSTLDSVNVDAKHVASLYENGLLSFISSSHDMRRKIRREPAKELLTELQGKLGAIPAGHWDLREQSSVLWAQELGFCENIVWSSVAFNADSASIRKKGIIVSQQQNISATCHKGVNSQFTTVCTSLIQGCQSIVAKNNVQSVQLPWVHWSTVFEMCEQPRIGI